MPDPDAPAALLEELTGAASRLLSPPAVSASGHPTAYREIVDRQFQEAADRFVTSDGRTVEDALAFSYAARLILASAINGAANSPPRTSTGGCSSTAPAWWSGCTLALRI